MKVTQDIRKYAANRERISQRWQVRRVSPLRAALALPTDAKTVSKAGKHCGTVLEGHNENAGPGPA
jgi:hypothetical protein